MFWGGSFFFDLFPILFTIVFCFVFGTILVNIIRSIGQWNKNNHSPRLTVEASVISRRTNVTHNLHDTGDGMHHTSTSTDYYVTFQVASGDRMEFRVSGREYGMLIEGDKGDLSFQGTRFLGFERRF